jgi:membrane-bound ClpP family serine protease
MVNIWYIIIVLAIVALIVVAVVISVKAHKKRIGSGKEAFVGRTGSAVTDINPTGRFYVYGEYWNAHARGEPLKAGDKGRIVEINTSDDRYLVVEKYSD